MATPQPMFVFPFTASSGASVRPRFLAEVADLGREMRPEALLPLGTSNRLFGDEQDRHKRSLCLALRSQTLRPNADGSGVTTLGYLKEEKNLKTGATGAVGMCASRRDVHISIAEGVSGNGRCGEREAFSTPVGDRAVRCGQRDSVTLSMPSGVQACMAGGAAA